MEPPQEQEAECQMLPIKNRKLKTQDIPPYGHQGMCHMNQISDEEQVFGDFCAS